MFFLKVILFRNLIPQALQMWSRHVRQACVRGARMEGMSKVLLGRPSALSRAACFSWSSSTLWCPTLWPCGSHFLVQKKQRCRQSTTSCYWLSVAETSHWAPAMFSVTLHWRWSWMFKRRCMGYSSTQWSKTWRSMLLSWPPSETANCAGIANCFAIACCGIRPSPMLHVAWYWSNPSADTQTGEQTRPHNTPMCFLFLSQDWWSTIELLLAPLVLVLLMVMALNHVFKGMWGSPLTGSLHPCITHDPSMLYCSIYILSFFSAKVEQISLARSNSVHLGHIIGRFIVKI